MGEFIVSYVTFEMTIFVSPQADVGTNVLVILLNYTMALVDEVIV